MSSPGQCRRTRREFIVRTTQTGALLSVLGSGVARVSAACAFPYGSGLYGQSCYAGSLPGLLSLPVAQPNIAQNGFRFFLTGEPNRSYRIEYSSDMASWTPLGVLTVPADGSQTEILDSGADTQRFYRATPL